MKAYNAGKFDGNTPLPSRESRFFPASVFAESDPAPREWLVPDLIPSGTVTLLGGDGGTGKSLLALQLAVSVATDSAWLGLGVGSGADVRQSALRTTKMNCTAASLTSRRQKPCRCMIWTN